MITLPQVPVLVFSHTGVRRLNGGTGTLGRKGFGRETSVMAGTGNITES